MMRSHRPGLAALLLLPLLSSCIIQSRSLQVRRLDSPVPVTSPVKAHMRDGTIVVFPAGISVLRDTIYGQGQRFNWLQTPLGRVQVVALDSIVGLTNYRNVISVPKSIIYSASATASAVLGTALLAVALFGSCPTFYADDGGTAVLEAEGFSYSIAPLFESRDVDALRVAPGARMLTLQVRNEALETHYINHLEVLAVEHAEGERVLPNGRGNLALFGSTLPALRAVDAAGRDLTADLRARDSLVFASTEGRLAAATENDLMDHLDLDFGMVDADTVALVMRARNSLLTTVLLYDVMLGNAGARAVDWIAGDLEQVGNAAELGKWYVERMGMRISVWRDGAWHESARMPDVGPIAWEDIAVMLPAVRGQPLRIRIAMPADGWRIDHVALAANAHTVQPMVLPLTAVRKDGRPDASSLGALVAADEAYVITEPGQSFHADFALPELPAGRKRSYMLASQGYYLEWIRPDWVRAAKNVTFAPNDRSLLEAMQKWHAKKQTLEHDFYAMKIPVQP
jgi:hypothetical protein